MENPLSKFTFICQFYCLPLWLELFIRSVALQSTKLSHVENPLVGFQVLGVKVG
jgi:hypothetical protein